MYIYIEIYYVLSIYIYMFYVYIYIYLYVYYLQLLEGTPHNDDCTVNALAHGLGDLFLVWQRQLSNVFLIYSFFFWYDSDNFHKHLQEKKEKQMWVEKERLENPHYLLRRVEANNAYLKSRADFLDKLVQDRRATPEDIEIDIVHPGPQASKKTLSKVLGTVTGQRKYIQIKKKLL
jgi:hypothetical protein